MRDVRRRPDSVGCVHTRPEGNQMPNNSRNLPIKARVTPEFKREVQETAAEYRIDSSDLIRQLLMVWLAHPEAAMPDGPWREDGATPAPVAAHG